MPPLALHSATEQQCARRKEEVVGSPGWAEVGTRSRARLQQLSPSLFLYRDTCNVYVLRAGARAILIDFGSGDVLDELPALGVARVTDLLVTHHHRDQLQGLGRAVEAGIRIWVPLVEQDLVG